MDYILHQEQLVKRSIEEVFAFFSDAHNLERITPAFLKFKIESMDTPQIQQGTKIRYSLRLHGIRVRWTTEIEVWEPPHRFVDLQLSGPYRYWRHEHTFTSVDGRTRVVDDVHYMLPFGILGRIAHSFVRQDVEKIFNYRREQIELQFRP